MVKQVAILLVVALGIGSVSAHGRQPQLVFDGGIGVIPVSGVVAPANPDGTFPNVTRNIVRGINPSGQNWRIADLRASIFEDGRIRVRGRGLLLAGGNNIGFNANLSVFATLICEPAAPFSEHSTNPAGVPLDFDGGFRIDDTLNSAPGACASPVLLIRSTSGTWLAAGILRGDDDNND
jgi:hypothetical protein